MRIGRRNFLFGAASTLALPWLESLPGGEAEIPPAAPRIRRFVCLFFGNGIRPEHWWSRGDGAAMELSKSLQPLMPHRKEILTFTGLNHGANAEGDTHASTTANLLSGAPVRKAMTDIQVAVSMDQLMAARIGHRTAFPSLALHIDPDFPPGAVWDGYSRLYTTNISWTSPSMPAPKERDPRRIFDRLFGTPPDGRHLGSVLDGVRADAAGLSKQVSVDDRRRLDEYLTAVREVETRIARGSQQRPTAVTAVRPPEGIPVSRVEHLRMMSDLMVLALQTDRTRIITHMLTNEISEGSFTFLDPKADNYHRTSHFAKDAHEMIQRFHVEQYAHLIARLAAIREGEHSLLDNSAVLLISGLGDGEKHAKQNLPVILAGRCGGALRPGRALDAARTGESRLGALLLTLMHAMDVPEPAIGSVTSRMELT